jgi:hypothetical protein
MTDSVGTYHEATSGEHVSIIVYVFLRKIGAFEHISFFGFDAFFLLCFEAAR